MDATPYGSETSSRLPALPARPGRTRRPMGIDGVGVDAPRPFEIVANADVLPHPAADVLPHVEPAPRAERLDRAVNVTIAAVAMIVLSPLFLLLALAVRLTSRGPILYTQTRVGLDRRRHRIDALYDRRMQDLGGSIFTIYKFRTMYVNAEAASGAIWAKPGDPRVTPLGRVMRKLRLDELPQLYNVLKGDMNIVGPRPERPSIFARLRENISEYPLRQRAKPGITGWAQINQAYDSDLDDVRAKVRYDLEYIQRQSLSQDFKIMLKTLPVVVFRRGGW